MADGVDQRLVPGARPQVAEVLLRAGADIDVYNARGENPLQWAAWSGSAALMELLLAHGADLHARDRTFGWTPLLCAAHQVHPSQVLHSCGCDSSLASSLLSSTSPPSRVTRGTEGY